MTEKAWIIDTEPSKRFPVFTRLNAADVMPEPITPLAASMCWKPMVLPGWASGYVQDACFTSDEMVEESAVAGFLYGYLYINQSSVRVLGIRKGMTWELIDQMFFNSPGAPTHAASESDANEALSAAAPARSGWVLTTTNFPEVEEDEILADRIRNERPNLKGLSNRALIARARSVMPYERLAWRSEQMGSSNAALGPAVAGMMLGEKAHLLVTILGHAGEVESAAPTYAVWALSRTLRADAKATAIFDQGLAAAEAAYRTEHGQFWSEFGAFISEFGFRGPSEWDLGTDSWESKPSLALALVDRMRQLGDEDSPHAKQAAHAGAQPAGDSDLGIADLAGSVWQVTDACVDGVTAGAVLLRGGAAYQAADAAAAAGGYAPRYIAAAGVDLNTHLRLPLVDESTLRSALVGFRCVVDTPAMLATSMAAINIRNVSIGGAADGCNEGLCRFRDNL